MALDALKLHLDTDVKKGATYVFKPNTHRGSTCSWLCRGFTDGAEDDACSRWNGVVWDRVYTFVVQLTSSLGGGHCGAVDCRRSWICSAALHAGCVGS